MAKTPARAVTDSELLSDEEDAGFDHADALDSEGDNSLDALDRERDSHDEPAPDTGDLEVVILDEDEGKGKKVEAEPEEDADSQGPPDDDDGGEIIDEAPEELTPWEKKNYSKAMQQRVLRERRIARQARDKAESETVLRRKAQADALEAQKLSTTLLSGILERDIREKEALLEKAMEDGVTKDVVKLNGELGDLRAQKRDVDATKDRLEKAKPEETQDAPAQSPDTERWLSRNRWFANQQFADEAGFARMIDANLARAHKEGRFRHAPGTSAYFVELDKRIHEKMPTLRGQIRKAYGDTRPASPRVAPVVRSAPSRPMGNKVVLTRDDLRNMQDFGFDPANKAHLKEYAEAKRKREREERGTS